MGVEAGVVKDVGERERGGREDQTRGVKLQHSTNSSSCSGFDFLPSSVWGKG